MFTSLPGSRFGCPDLALAKNLLVSIGNVFLPAAMSLGASALISMVDIWLAGFLGNTQQAAIGMADQFLYLITMLGAGLATACTAYISQASGASRLDQVRLYARESILLALITGVLSSVACYVLASPAISLLHCEQQIRDSAVEYTMWCAPANTAYMVSICLVAIFRSIGRPRAGLFVWATMSTICIVLSLAFFFVPQLVCLRSVKGLALAWDIASYIGMFGGLIVFAKTDSIASIFMLDVRASVTRIKSIVNLAIPAMLAELAATISNVIIYRILCDASASHSLQAAWTIRIRLEETFAISPLTALSMAMTVVVGQNLGARRLDRAQFATALACAAAVFSMSIMGFAVCIHRTGLVSFFTQDASTSHLTLELLVPYAVLMVLMPISYVLSGSLDAAGLTRLPMVINFFCLIFIRSGIVYMSVGLDDSVQGLNLACVVSTIFQAAISVICFFHAFHRRSLLLKHVASS